MSSEHGDFSPLSLSTPGLLACAEQIAEARVLIIGDVMVDEYLIGDAERVSPEAPVPVVRIEEEKLLVGGAGNVARNITALGGNAILIGVRGSDAAGQSLERSLHQDGVIFSLLRLAKRPTTIKTRVLARQQQMLRLDREETRPLSENDSDALIALVAEHLPDCGAVVLSDYGKGLVSQRLMTGLQRLVADTGREIPLLVDPKPQNFNLYKDVTILTPNAKEASASISLPTKTPRDIMTAGQAIMKKLGCHHLLITLGHRGMVLFENPESVWHVPTAGKQVYDVTGAGDTVIAVLSMGYAMRLSPIVSSLLANYTAGLVINQIGAATANPGQLVEAITAQPELEIKRWKA